MFVLSCFFLSKFQIYQFRMHAPAAKGTGHSGEGNCVNESHSPHHHEDVEDLKTAVR